MSDLNSPACASARLVDPVHFFNSVGVSILTQRHQDERIAALEAENAELKRRLESAVRRLREVIGDADNEMRN